MNELIGGKNGEITIRYLAYLPGTDLHTIHFAILCPDALKPAMVEFKRDRRRD